MYSLKMNKEIIHLRRRQIFIVFDPHGSIHILRNHIFWIFGPPSLLRNHGFSTENNQKLAFSDPPPPTSDYV